MKVRQITCVLALVVSGLLPAQAADMVYEAPPAAPPVETNEWKFTMAPYLWGAGLSGDIGLFGQDPTNIDIPFSDILKDLDFAGMLVSELNNGTWGVLADVIYVKTTSDTNTFGQIGNTPAALRVGVETSTFTGTLMGEYRVLSQPNGILDLMAGVRVWNVNNDITARLAAGGQPVGALSGSDGDTWVDPMVGIKGRIDLTPKWNLSGWGMIGGFGAGSDLTWDVLGAVGYNWTDHFSTRIGYRAIGVDYENDGFVYDTIQHGPIVGILYQF